MTVINNTHYFFFLYEYCQSGTLDKVVTSTWLGTSWLLISEIRYWVLCGYCWVQVIQ